MLLLHAACMASMRVSSTSCAWQGSDSVSSTLGHDVKAKAGNMQSTWSSHPLLHNKSVLADCYMVSAVDVLGKAMAGLDHAGFLALEATEVAFIILGWVPGV